MKTPKGYVELDTKTEIHTLSNGDLFMIFRDKNGNILGEKVIESEENRKKMEENDRLKHRPPSRKGQPPFARLWIANLIQIVREKSKERKLSNSEAGVLFKLMAFLNWQSTILVHPDTGKAVNTKEIAVFLGMELNYLSQHLEKLIQKGFISRNYAGKGRAYKYQFNCHLAFFGSRMNDIAERDLFDPDSCSYIPEYYVKFQSEDKESRKCRRDVKK